MAIIDLQFQIKRGVIDDKSIEDPKIKKIVNECKELCRLSKHDDAVRKLFPYISFDWDWSNGDADVSAIFVEPKPIRFQCDESNCVLQVGVSDDYLLITATTTFTCNGRDDVEIKADDLAEWLDNNSMYACGHFNGGWSYLESDGDNVWVKRINSAGPS